MHHISPKEAIVKTDLKKLVDSKHTDNYPLESVNKVMDCLVEFTVRGVVSQTGTNN